MKPEIRIYFGQPGNPLGRLQFLKYPYLMEYRFYQEDKHGRIGQHWREPIRRARQLGLRIVAVGSEEGHMTVHLA